MITLDRHLAALLLQPLPAIAPTPDRLTGPEEPLTARELEVLQLLAEGLPNKIIATRLHITEHTANSVSSILMKLGAASRTEAVTTAARRGLLML